jgi:multidrug efflux pump
MSSQSGNDGSYSLTVTFDINVDIKTALVMVQNRVALAMPQLPSAVQNQGITIRKRTPDMLLIVNFISPDGRYNDEYLSNYATIYCKDELLRVYGISDVLVQGQRDYSMRVWLDPQKLAARNMTAMDVANSIVSENSDAPAGRIGQPPSPSNQAFQYPLDTLGRLRTTEQFGDIVVKIGGKPTVLSSTGKVMGSVTKMSMPSNTPGSPMLPSGGSNGGSPYGITPMTTSTTDDSSTSSGSSGAAPSPTDLTAIASGSTADASSGSTMGATGTTGSKSGSMSSMIITPGTIPGMPSNSGGGAAGPPPTVDSLPTPSVSVVRLRDVARLELGAQNYNTLCSFNGQPAVGLGLYQLPGTNALDVADDVYATMKRLKKSFPDGVDYKIAYDTTLFIRDSVNDVQRTLLIAVGLVAIVVMVFLQSWRAAIIPLVAVPVAIIGTFAVMGALGYSLNNISLFGLVLAIGIVVDDAIVVVENVERWMERGLESREATRRAMDETLFRL